MTNWLQEQINKRVAHDNELLSRSMASMVNIVSLEKVEGFMDDDLRHEEAIGEVLRYFHINEDIKVTDIKNIDEQIDTLLHPYGIMRRRIRLSKGWSKNAIGIMIGSYSPDGNPKKKKIVTIVPDKFGGYHIQDGDKSIRITSKNEKLVNDEAICFYMPLPLRKLNSKDLVKYALNSMRVNDYVLFAVAAFIVAIIGMVLPIITKYLYSDVVEYKSQSMLVALFVALLSSTIAKVLIDVIKQIISLNINTKICSHIECAMMMRVLSLPASAFSKYSSAEFANYIWQLVAICDTTLSTALSIVFSSIFSIVYFVLIFIYTPSLLLPAAIVVGFMLLHIVIVVYLRKDVYEKYIFEDSKENGMVYSLISGMQKIKIAGAEKRMFAKWGEQYTKAATYLYNPPAIIKFEHAIVTGISLIGMIVIYNVALKHNIDVPSFMAFESAYGLITLAFFNLVAASGTVARTFATTSMIKPILEIEPEVSERRKNVSELKGQIEFNNVSFRYNDNMNYIVDDMSFKIKSGEYVAIVGKTGCGKSTLIKLILGFEKPEIGAVYFDGKDVNGLDLKSLRKNIGVVLQNGKLIAGSIYENIAIAAEKLTLDEAWEIAKIAGIYDDIKNMPMGMHTVLYEGQGGISGGQKQRIMIARALAKKPKILIFDEATSALDNITQKKVSNAIDKFKCTRIVIAHRLSTIKNCDRILVLDKGKIIEEGNYNTLMKKNGVFKELVKRQTL